MWNERFKWFFEEGTPNGFNDGGIAEFASTKYDGLAREIIQNSLDARLNEDNPVKVVFEKNELDFSLFPDVDGYLDTIERCLDFLKEDKGNKSISKLKGIYDYILHCKKQGKFNVLKISDYNTCGLDGTDRIYGSSWANLVRISGNSNKGNGSQGSFGIGKFAPFVFSNIRSIIYSTKDRNGNVAVQGKSILSGHIADGNTRTPFGYFGEINPICIDSVTHDNSKPIIDELNIPEPFLRKEIGTTLYVLCSKTEISWEDDILSSIVNSFFFSIFNKKLEVEIINHNNKILVNNDSIMNHIDYCMKKFASREVKITSDLFKLVQNRDLVNEYNHSFDLPNGTKGTMKLLLFTNKDIVSKSIVHIRKAGMKIEEYSPKSLLSYIGVAMTTNNEMNEFLTTCEAPKHDAWSSNNCGDEESQNKARKILRELSSWERECVRQLTPANESERLDPLGMEEFLASDIDDEIGNVDDENRIENFKFKPLKTELKKRNVTKQTYSILDQDDGLIPNEDGDKEIEGGNGSNNGTGGDNHGNGGNPEPVSRGDGPLKDKTKEKVEISFVKTPYLNEKGKYIISFIPTFSKNNCELKVRLAGDDVLENAEISELYLLNETGKKEVATFDLIANEKITFEVHFKNIDRGALEVSCYAKK